MTQFKVGDKVRMTDVRGFGGIEVGDVAVVTDITTNGQYTLTFDYLTASGTIYQWFYKNHYNDYPFKLVNEEEPIPMLTVSYTVTPDSISIFWNGRMHNINSTDLVFDKLKAELQGIAAGGAVDPDTLDDLLDKPKVIQEKTQGNVTVRDGQVFYRGEEVEGPLVSKLLSMLTQELDFTRWMKFLDNLMDNPSFRARTCLYNFLEHFDTPITEDGCFLAFKRVRNNYFDIHSNSMDNSPGNIVRMERRDVNEDPNQTCSSGLHACASNYLGSFYATSPGCKVVVLKVNPRDVVAVPADYQFSKMRVCEYEVLGDAEEADYDTVDSGRVPDRFEGMDPEPSYFWEDFDSELDDYDSDYDSY